MNHQRLSFAMILGIFLCLVNQISQASWEPIRNAGDRIVIDVAGQNEEFDYELSGQKILTGFPVGHNIPRSTNHLFYNMELDGYGGLPFGNCLRRGYLLPDSDPNKALCTANENKDLMRVWSNRNPDLQHVFIKNLTIKNAFRTYNAVDGVVVENSRGLPHTDTFQTFYPGSAQENPEWLVIQDSVIRNSDNNLMISSSSFKGILYHNLITSCEEEFRADDRQRAVNDHIEFSGNPNPPVTSCGNAVSAGTFEAAPVWLVDVAPGGGTANVSVTNEFARVVVVGNQEGDYRVLTRNSARERIDHPNVRYYPNIEAALATETSRPPFLELSCSGWASPPDNCEDRRGYLADGSSPVDTGDDPDDDDSEGDSGGSEGDPDGSDRPDDPDTPPDGADTPNTNASPVAHWRLDEISGSLARDSSGSQNGSLLSIPSNQWNTSNARIGRSSLRFDGSDERVSLGNIDFSGPQISLMGWVRPSNIEAANGEGRIISKASGTSEQNHYWMLSTDENGSGVIVPRVRLKTNRGTETLLGSNASGMINNQWSHIAATYDGQTLRLFFNGALVGSTPMSGQVSGNSSVGAAIGNQPAGGRGFVGLIDDVCIFSVAVTSREIARLYNAGTGRSCNQLGTVTPPNPPSPPGQIPNANSVFVPGFLLLLDDDED